MAAGESDEDERPGSDVPAVPETDVGDGAAEAGAGGTELAAGGGSGSPDDGEAAVDGDAGNAEAASPDSGDAPAAHLHLVTIPNFRGLTIAAALRAARQNNVELVLDDRTPPSGVALRQSPGPGPAPRGVPCKVSFGRPL